MYISVAIDRTDNALLLSTEFHLVTDDHLLHHDVIIHTQNIGSYNSHTIYNYNRMTPRNHTGDAHYGANSYSYM